MEFGVIIAVLSLSVLQNSYKGGSELKLIIELGTSRVTVRTPIFNSKQSRCAIISTVFLLSMSDA